ncbi:MAG: SRPBCC family protein [Cyanobacteriota bacterium]|nr:SRPBCC family protein [Cyanobacteriota bacterium]
MSVVLQKRRQIISAPIEVVWDQLTRIGEWPTWYSRVRDMRFVPPLEVGKRFEYSNDGTRILAEVVELSHPHRFAVVGKAWGVTAHNEWQLIALSPTTTEVIVQEEMRGFLPWLLRGLFNRKLGEGLEFWLGSLAEWIRKNEGLS